MLYLDHLLHLVNLFVILVDLLLHHIEVYVCDASLMLQLLLCLRSQLAQCFLVHRVQILVRAVLFEIIVIIM